MSSPDFSHLAAIATTPQGARLLQPLCQSDALPLWVPRSLASDAAVEHGETVQVYDSSLRDCLAQLWPESQGLIFCLAAGAVVRLIAPLLQHKSVDPAVVVVDEAGQFVISLCSGHQGGADRLAQWVAAQLGATPVLTGAAQALNLPGIDVLGRPFGWRKGAGDWTAVSSAIARQETVQVCQTAGSELWQEALPTDHPFQFQQADEIETVSDNAQARVWIGTGQPAASNAIPEVCWHPRLLWVGIGCERGTSETAIARAIEQTFQQHQLSQAAIAGIASLDLKADEVGLVTLCHQHQWPLRCFSAEQLSAIAVPTPSATVAAAVGTPSVAEAAALLAAQRIGALPPQQQAGKSTLLVPKQIYRWPEEAGAVTIAIAQAERESIDHPGQLSLVGIGPGHLMQMTPAAKATITQADAVVGYQLYMNAIAPLLRPGQLQCSLPITQERQRAEIAVDWAGWGLNVAVVSSGDCGIYGMGGLVFETLTQQQWDGKTPGVQVFPGISALQATAARVGAPLMHDFCAISLSDLLTPWETIENRLVAAAAGDFVVALYNPRSQTRRHQIEQAQRIFLQHRDPATPVAIVRAAYRTEETIALSTLERFLDESIDMLSTVLIGNCSTYPLHDRLVTPRGYHPRPANASS